MKILVLAVFWIIPALILGACSTKGELASLPPMTPGPATKAEMPGEAASSREGFEAEWQKLLAEAQKEGSIVIYGSTGPVPQQTLAINLREKFGIRMEAVGGQGGLLAEKILKERKAGLYAVDVYLSGSATIIESLKPAGALMTLDPLFILPELKDPELMKKTFWQGKPRWSDAEHKVLVTSLTATPMISVNNSLIKPVEIQSYRDLLLPKFKDKIIMGDPTISGGTANNIGMLGSKIMGWDWVVELARQNPAISRDERLIVEWLARGKYSIAIGGRSDILAEFINAGAPLQYIKVKESTHLSGATAVISLLDRAPHPRAAKFFLNWFLSKEGQSVFVPSGFYQSTRLDVPFDHVPVERRRETGVEYYYSDDEEWLLKRTEYQKRAQEIFRSLLTQ